MDALIVSDSDSMDILELTGLSEDELPRAPALIQHIATRLGVTPMDKAEALRYYAIDIARNIVSGAMDPFVGARAIWTALRRTDLDTHEFDPFIYAASEIEDRPNEKRRFRKGIIDEARKLCSSINKRE